VTEAEVGAFIVTDSNSHRGRLGYFIIHTDVLTKLPLVGLVVVALSGRHASID
jgi:hypothetical protein